MRTTATLLHFLLPLLAATTSVSAQDDYATGLKKALETAGLSTLATALGLLPSSFLSGLQNGNHTVFAPNNAALSSLPPSLLADVSSLTSVIAYHISAGLISTSDTGAGNHTIVRTALQGPPNVFLPGNQTQVLVVTETSQGNLTVVDAKGNFTSQGTAVYENLKVEVISSVLTVPGNLSTVLTSNSQTSALVSAGTAVDPSVFSNLEKIYGLTIFAPNTAAFTAAASVLASANATTIGAVLSNHIINGTAVYSPLITNSSSFISAGGEKLTFATNSSGTWVTSGNSSAKIVQSDIIIANGVVHLIDGILLNTNTDPNAAASAEASASSAQATQTSIATAPISAGASTTSGSSSTTTGGSGSSGAAELKTLSAWVMGLFVVGLGAVLA